MAYPTKLAFRSKFDVPAGCQALGQRKDILAPAQYKAKGSPTRATTVEVKKTTTVV